MRKRIGDIFLEKGLLTKQQLKQVLEFSKANSLRLGDSAVKLGFILPKTLQKIFGKRNREEFFYLDVNYFPVVTHSLFDIPTILRYGVLPLGFKTDRKLFRTRKILNLGFLNPGGATMSIPELSRLAKSKLGEDSFQDVKVYLIIAEQFLEVLSRKYDFLEARVRVCESDLDEILEMYLNTTISPADEPRKVDP